MLSGAPFFRADGPGEGLPLNIIDEAAQTWFVFAT
jgi:hypothetical protein